MSRHLGRYLVCQECWTLSSWAADLLSARPRRRIPAPFSNPRATKNAPSLFVWLFFPQRPAARPTRVVSSPGDRRQLRSRSRKTATLAVAAWAVAVSPTSATLAAAPEVAAAEGSCKARLPILAPPTPPYLRLQVVPRLQTWVRRERRSTLWMVRAGWQDPCCGRLERSREAVGAAVV